MTRHIAALLTLLALGTAAVPAQDDASAPEAAIAGSWETSQGPLEIVQQGENSYVLVFAAIPGLVTGLLSDNRLIGTWTRADGPGPCPTEVDGSRHWGRFGIEFHPEQGFAGAWTYCDARPQGVNFTGARAP